MPFDGIRRAFRVPLFTKRQLEREVDDEIAFHIAQRAERLRMEGMSAEAAIAEARRRFGDPTIVRDECVDLDQDDLRRDRVMSFIDDLRGDVRFAWRSLKRAPGFALTALTTLVIGIAALTSIFSYMDAIYFAPLPYHDAGRMVAVSQQLAGPGSPVYYSGVAPEVLPLVRQATHSFERIATYDTDFPSVVFGGEPVQLQTLAIDTAFIPLFDLRPELGRLLSPEEITGGATSAMISDQLWRTRFGADSAVLGRPFQMGARTLSIVGVLPPGFRFPYQTDAIFPLHPTADSTASARDDLVSVIAKLRPGVTREEARGELTLIASRLASIDSKHYRGAQLLVRDEVLDRKGRQFLPLPTLFLSAGVFLLLIACANVANLFYVRAAERREEMAIRASLGAGRHRLIRQALTESLLISIAAAFLGTWLSMLLLRIFLHLIPTSGFPSWFHVAIDYRVLGFAIGVTALVTIAVGLAPAREGTRFDLAGVLKSGGSAGSSSRSAARGSKRGLVVQLGLSVALFTTAALLARSYQRLIKIDFGYPAEQIASVAPLFDNEHYGDYTSPQRIAFAEDIAARAAQLPGVRGVALRGDFGRLRALPNEKASIAAADQRRDSRLIPDGDTTRAIREPRSTETYTVSDSFFGLMTLRVLQGRSFGPSDALGVAPVAVISARTASLLWGQGSPVGHTIQIGSRSTPFTIIGVVTDVHDIRGGSAGLTTEAGVTIYTSTRQATSQYPAILLTSRGNLTNARRAVVELVHAADPTLVLLRESTLATQLDQVLMQTSVVGGVIAAFAVSALLLSIVGIYGVVAFGIAQRTREIGIRIALGGSTNAVVRMITRETLRFVSVGLVIGLALATLLGRGVKIFLYGVTPLDPITYVIVCVLFCGIALLASYVPARRVVRIDPLTALRSE